MAPTTPNNILKPKHRLTKEEARIYQNLSGLAFMVLVIFFRLNGATGSQELEAITLKSRHKIKQALLRLEGAGLIEQRQRFNGWVLTAQGRQLPLFDSRLKFFISPPQEEEVKQLKDKNINILTSSSLETRLKISTSPELLAYLTDAGVYPNMRSWLAQKLDNDLELAKSYFDALDVGLAVYRIANDIPPDADTNQEPAELTDEEKYTGGEFAHLINVDDED